MISGAVRSLNLKSDTRVFTAKVRGCVVFRQPTMIHPSQLPRLEQYIKENYYAPNKARVHHSHH